MRFMNLDRQYDLIKDEVLAQLEVVLNHGQYIMGPEVITLEQQLSEFADAKHCVGVSSGTDALLIAMMALGIGPGDEVITTPFSFIATSETIVLLGAKPVYADIDDRTFNIDPAAIEGLITAKTKAIIPVSLFGQCSDMDAINAFAQQHGIAVIEDAAQSFGATYKNRKSCAVSAIATTSFYPSKPLGGYGDSGACFTDDEALAEKMRTIRVHGQTAQYQHTLVGVNGRLDSMQAAILLSKLARFKEDLANRQRLGDRYTSAFKAAGFEHTPFIEPHNTSAYAQYTVKVDQRAEVIARLREKNVPAMIFYPTPLHQQPAVADPDANCPISEAMSKQVMSLPICAFMTDEEQEEVIDAFIESIN